MKKIFPILLIGTLIGGGGILFAIWNLSSTTSADFLASGKKYYEDKQYSKADIQFANAIQKDPKNRDARYFRALNYLAQNDLVPALKALQSLLEDYPDYKEANLKLAGIYLTGGGSDPRYYQEAAKIAAKILGKEPNDVDALLIAGNAAAGQHDYAGSLQSFQQAASLDPQNATPFTSIGTSQTLQKHYPEAEEAFHKALAIDPKNRGALISLANYYHKLALVHLEAGDRAKADEAFAKADEAFKEAIAAYPTDLAIHTELVQYYYQTNRFDEAVKLLQALQAKSPESPAPSLLLGDMYLAKNRVDDARNLLVDLKKTYPKDLDVAARLAAVLMGTDIPQAQQEVERILAAAPASPTGNLLKGKLSILIGKYDDAEAILNKPQVVNSNLGEAQFFLGTLASRKRDFNKAQDHFERAVKMNPGYMNARVALAEALLNNGKSAEGRKELQQALELQKDFLPARIMMATLNRVEKRYPEAEAELTALAKEQPQNALIHQQMAILNSERGKPAEAEKNLNKALELDPNSFETFAALVQLDVKAGQSDNAVKRINAVPEAQKSARHYELLGAVYQQAKKLTESEAAFKKALEKDPKRSAADAFLASQYIQSGRLDEGLGKLDDLLRKAPQDAAGIGVLSSAYGTKGQIYEEQGKMAEAIKSYEAALKANPKEAGAANNLAYIYAEKGENLDIALRLAQDAKKNAPESPEIADTLGWVYYKMGSHGLAKEQLQFAVSKQADNPTLHYHLGMIYKATKQLKESEAEFKKALASPNDFKEKSLAQDALKEVKQSR